MLHRDIALKKSGIEGLGLFATAPIKEGEVIWERDDNEVLYPVAEVDSWPEERRAAFWRYAYQVDAGHYAAPGNPETEDPADYMNHSCNPTAWYATDAVMVAMRDIDTGEEITYDYVMSEASARFLLDCRCGSANCRGTIRGSDYRTRPELQARYGMHVMNHVRATLTGD